MITYGAANVSHEMDKNIAMNVKNFKQNDFDDHLTEYVDIDILINLYMESFKTNKRGLQNKLKKKFSMLKGLNTDPTTFHDYDRLINECLNFKSPSPLVKFAGKVSFYRAYVYSLMCERNNEFMDEEIFCAGLNRFGCENLVPINT